MIIAQISDTHIALDAPDADQRISDFERAIADINALDPAPDVIVHTGDVVHNGRSDEYQEAVRILANARAPVYVIPGNKDDRANLFAAFSPRGYVDTNSDFIEYAIEDYPVRLISADTLNARSNKGDFCPERAERLIDLINAEKIKPVAVLAHHPPFEVMVGPDSLHFESQEMMERLRRALQQSSRVIAVFSGHVHRGTNGHIGTIPVMVAPCIATTLRKGTYPAHMKTRPVYYLHRLDPLWGFVAETRIVGTELASSGM
ncbi:MAG TPA: metallophosphoesterase [Pseudolabrys sp.]|nr:metallophosphoesterase [Pseudolabrys sp.]